MIEGNDSIWTEGNSGTLLLASNGKYSLFENLMIDGKLVNKDAYTVTEGSTRITLKADYLNNLKPGEHAVKFLYRYGITADGVLHIIEKTSDTNTADKSAASASGTGTVVVKNVNKTDGTTSGQTSIVQVPATSDGLAENATAAAVSAGIAAGFLAIFDRKKRKCVR